MTRVKQPQGQKHAQSQRGDKAGTGRDVAERCTHCHGQDVFRQGCTPLPSIHRWCREIQNHTCVSSSASANFPKEGLCGGKQKVSTKTGTLLIPLRVTPHITSCRVYLHHLATRKHSRGKCWADTSQHGIVHQGHRRESVIFLSRSVGIWLRHH